MIHSPKTIGRDADHEFKIDYDAISYDLQTSRCAINWEG